jgi:hypothetical protein
MSGTKLNTNNEYQYPAQSAQSAPLRAMQSIFRALGLQTQCLAHPDTLETGGVASHNFAV